MKRSYLLGGLAAFTVMAGASLAAQAAQPGPPPGGPNAGPPRAEGRGPMMRHDGHRGGFRVTPEERKKLIAERFAKMDTNRDGRVTFEEFHAAREAARLERQKIAFSRITGGRDALTLEQLNERADHFKERRGEGRGEGRGPRGPFRGGGDRF